MGCFHSKGHPRSKNWTLDFEPAFSPRFSPTLSPRSLFHTRQRFPKPRDFPEPTILFSHWSAVSSSKSRDFRFHEPTILFSHSPAVSHSKSRDFRLYEPAILFSPLVSGFPLLKTRDFRFRVMTSLICSRPIRSQEITHTGVPYYSPCLQRNGLQKRVAQSKKSEK